MKDQILIILLILFSMLMGIIAHEADMARSFKKTGDASAWFFEIKK